MATQFDTPPPGGPAGKKRALAPTVPAHGLRRPGLRTISAKLLALYLPLVSVSAIAALAFVEARHFIAERAELPGQVETLAATQVRALGTAAWNYDIDQLTSLLDGLSAQPIVQLAVVSDMSGNVLALGGKKNDAPRALPVVLRFPLSYFDGDTPEQVATLTIGASATDIAQALKNRLAANAPVLAALIGSIVLVTMYVTRRVLGQPLTVLRRSIDSNRVEGTHTPVSWNSEDELGELVEAYNAMLQLRASDEAELKAHRDNLEIEVNLRTAKLERTEARLTTVLDNSPIAAGVSVADRFVYTNRRFQELFGFSEGATATAQDVYAHHAQRDHVIAQLLVDDTIRNEELELRRADGSPITTVSTFFNIEHDDQPGVLGWHYDITDRKRQEDELLAAKAAAEMAVETKANFLATMSHEIRTPMNGVLGMAELLAETGLNKEQRSMLRTMRDSGQSLLRIINDILDFSKIEAGKLTLEQVPMSLLRVVEDTAATLAPLAEGKSILLVTQVDVPAARPMLGDPVRFRQVLFNLLGNAIKFSEAGGEVLVRVAVAADASSDNRIRMSVIDHGIGMTDAVRANLFAAFMQADAATTRKFGGTGLGLVIVQRLVETMGGSIEVASEAGKGSTFTVDVPMPLCDDHAQAPATVDLTGLQVAFIHRNATARDAARMYLQDAGADVILLSQGPAQQADVVVYADDADHAQALAAANAHAGEATTVVAAQAGGESVDPAEGWQDIVPLRVNPMRRDELVEAVAHASRRESAADNEEQSTNVVPNPSAAPVADDSPSPTAQTGGLILVAEDNLINQKVISRQLEQLGYACDIADDGEKALAMYRSGSYAILLSDCHMPNMDGYELSAAIRAEQRPGQARLPIVAITASALEGEDQKCLAAGMDDYLTKPVDMSKLKEALERWFPRV